jgi:hypothetical protein
LLLSEEKYLKTTINIKKENIISTFLDSLLGNPGFSFYKEYPGSYNRMLSIQFL